MGRFDRRNLTNRFDPRHIKWLLAAAAAVVAIVIFGGGNTPPATSSTHRIAAGGHVRHLVGYQTVRSAWRRSNPSHYPAHRVEFASSGGAVEVCVVPCRIGYRADQWAHLDKMTAEFAAGRKPEEAVGQASGVRGRIDFTDPLQRGNLSQYAVFVRSPNDTDVTLVVHYTRYRNVLRTIAWLLPVLALAAVVIWVLRR